LSPSSRYVFRLFALQIRLQKLFGKVMRSPHAYNAIPATVLSARIAGELFPEKLGRTHQTSPFLRTPRGIWSMRLPSLQGLTAFDARPKLYFNLEGIGIGL
jgi:hypothetical protein